MLETEDPGKKLNSFIPVQATVEYKRIYPIGSQAVFGRCDSLRDSGRGRGNFKGVIQVKW